MSDNYDCTASYHERSDSHDFNRLDSAFVLRAHDAAVADVSYTTGVRSESPKTFTGTGASKRERGDSADPMTGELLAVARAYEELSARLHREARSRIRAQDAERTQRENRRRKAEARTRTEWAAKGYGGGGAYSEGGSIPVTYQFTVGAGRAEWTGSPNTGTAGGGRGGSIGHGSPNTVTEVAGAGGGGASDFSWAPVHTEPEPEKKNSDEPLHLLNLSDGRYITAENGYLTLHYPGYEIPVRLTSM